MTPIEQQPFGPDVSNHQGTIDWLKVQRAGASFALIKKSQGNTFSDGYYTRNLQGARAAGVIPGAYHYLSYNSLPIDQVHHYLDGLFIGPGMIQPILDVENWSDAGEGGPPRSAEYMTQWALDFVNQLHTLTGKWCIVYTYYWFFHNVLHNVSNFSALGCPLWEAYYGHKYPEPIGGWPFHTFHQFTDRGHLSGIPGHVDLNRFNGDHKRLLIMAGLAD